METISKFLHIEKEKISENKNYKNKEFEDIFTNPTENKK